jgi:hypothetical protein
MVLDASTTKMMLVFYGIQNGLVSRDEKFCPINVVKCMIRHYSLLHVYVVNSEMRRVLIKLGFCLGIGMLFLGFVIQVSIYTH